MTLEPAIIFPSVEGIHNENPEVARERMRGGRYRELSTICVTPAIKPVPPRIVHSWMNMRRPPNTKYTHTMAEGMEVGQAYSHAVEAILKHPVFSQFRFILTLETDNAPPADGLLRLLYDLDDHPEYCAMSGLYWTKGPGGVPQCWGNPEYPDSFFPFIPEPESLTHVNAIGMGFALWRMDLFRDERIGKPFFETTDCETQDIIFAMKLQPLGYKLAVNSSVRVGHWDDDQRVMW